jgi:hypothetical protein
LPSHLVSPSQFSCRQPCHLLTKGRKHSENIGPEVTPKTLCRAHSSHQAVRATYSFSIIDLRGSRFSLVGQLVRHGQVSLPRGFSPPGPKIFEHHWPIPVVGRDTQGASTPAALTAGFTETATCLSSLIGSMPVHTMRSDSAGVCPDDGHPKAISSLNGRGTADYSLYSLVVSFAHFCPSRYNQHRFGLI